MKLSLLSALLCPGWENDPSNQRRVGEANSWYLPGKPLLGPGDLSADLHFVELLAAARPSAVVWIQVGLASTAAQSVSNK